MYQLRRSCRGSCAANRAMSERCRNAADGGTDMIVAFSNGLSGMAASPVAAMAPQSWPMTTSRPVGPAASSTRSASSIRAPT